MKTVVYTSRLSEQVSDIPAVLNEIITQSQQNNLAVDVTGAMIFQNGQIIQVIEGEDGTLDKLYARITKDVRHTHITRLYCQPIRARAFKQWSMQAISITVEESFTTETIQLVSDLFDKRFVFRGDIYLTMLQAVFIRPEFMDDLMKNAA